MISRHIDLEMSHIVFFIACVLHPFNLAMSEHTVVAVVLTGDSIVLNCTGPSTGWRFYPPNYTGHGIEDKDIYMDGRLRPEFKEKGFGITENPQYGGVNLVIANVTSEWAGRYECQKENEIFNIYKLIVLENNIVCHLTTVPGDRIAQRRKTKVDCIGSCDSPQSEDSLSAANNEFIGPNACDIPQDQILVSCSATYFGTDTPVLELINPKVNKVIQTSCNTTTLNATVGYNRLTCNVTLNATLDLDGAQFIWQTNQSTTQTQYNFTTEPIKILYSIDDIDASSNPEIAQLNDTLNCTANCSHSCGYKWTWSEKFGQGLFKYEECTNEVKAIRPGFYKCESVCQIGRHLCEVTVMNVEVSSPTVSQQAGDDETNYVSVMNVTVSSPIVSQQEGGDETNSGSKISLSIVSAVITLGRLLDLWHKHH